MTTVAPRPTDLAVPLAVPFAVPLVDPSLVHAPMLDELRAAFERVLSRGTFTAAGEVERFEAAVADAVGVDHAVGVGSGTAALHLLLVAAGIGRGDEVVLPPNTFFATAEAVVGAGATPVFADVDARTALLSPDAAAAAVTPRTAAIIAVHLYGQPAPMDALRRVAARHSLLLVEDAAQAFGAAWDGREAGALGDAAAFSFYPGKNLGALGEAGAITTSDPVLARRVAMLRTHGESGKHVHRLVGWNERLDELQAAFLNVKLAHFGAGQAQRRNAVARYRASLSVARDVGFIDTDARATHAHHLFVVRVPRRDEVLARVRAHGVGAAVHYPTPIHLQPAFADLGVKAGSLPSAEALAREIVSLPLHAGITSERVEHCAQVLARAVTDA